MSSYPPGFTGWPEDRRNAFFAKAASDYREKTANASASIAKPKLPKGAFDSLDSEQGIPFHAGDGPLPLFPRLAEAEPYPADALGKTLSRAAKAIASKAQVPIAMAAQSVLAVASLAVSSSTGMSARRSGCSKRVALTRSF